MIHLNVLVTESFLKCQLYTPQTCDLEQCTDFKTFISKLCDKGLGLVIFIYEHAFDWDPCH